MPRLPRNFFCAHSPGRLSCVWGTEACCPTQVALKASLSLQPQQGTCAAHHAVSLPPAFERDHRTPQPHASSDQVPISRGLWLVISIGLQFCSKIAKQA